MNWKNVAKGILKGIQIPIVSPIPLIEEMLFNATEEEKNQEWKEKIESLLLKIDRNIIENLEKLENSSQLLAFSQIPLIFSKETKNKIYTILTNASNADSQEEQNQLINEFFEQIVSILGDIDIQGLNTKIEEFFKAEKEEIVVIKNRLISLTPISNYLLERINESVKYCKNKNIPYQTPNLLLALFNIPNSLAKRALDKLEDGLGDKYHKKIDYYVNFKQPQKIKEEMFQQFDWSGSEWGRLAKIEAFNDGYPVVAEKHMLLGILQSENSSTIETIKNKLGNNFLILLDIIKKESPFRKIQTNISDL